MTDEKSKNNLTTPNQPLTLDSRKRIGAAGSALHQRVAQAATKRVATEVAISALPNRIGMMLDDSGSMSGTKAASARVASKAFLDACDASTTAVAIKTFDPTFEVRLTNQLGYAASECQQLSGVGGTALAECMQEMINNEPITQAVIVSDGEANDPYLALETARTYREAGIVCDCVHIGDSTSGEATLHEIAKITEGIYVKFTDVTNFASHFKYLTPTYRALLPANKEECARLLGASEVS